MTSPLRAEADSQSRNRIEQDEGFRRKGGPSPASDAAKWQGLADPPRTTRPYRPGLAERLYLPLLSGLVVTMRHFVRNLFGKLPTIQYPEERRAYSHRFRGHHILTTRPDGSVRCVACFLCAQACPAECIHIEAGEHPDVNIEKYPVVYEIDMLRCIFCGYCVDACPEEAIIMSNNYDMAYFNRDQTIAGKAELVKPFTFDENRLGYRPRYPEEDAQRARMRREAWNLVEAARQAKAKEEQAAAKAAAS
jgi:NADH-quinone oxidoreductase subunit I